ncbi:MAG: hypothetical protein ABR969_05535 [Sedimentisphaerales bacterium]|jgi:hypothetical protein
MEWIKAIAELIGSFAWPATIFSLIIIFRSEIRKRLLSVTKVTGPGGIELTMEAERLAASIKQTPEPKVETKVINSLALQYTDPKLAITQVRIDLERELFRLSWRALEHSRVTDWHTSRHIDELERANVITPHFAQNIRSYIDIANQVIHGTEIPSEVVTRTVSIAGDLLSTLHYKRLVYEAQRDFEGHGLWHMKGRKDNKYYFLSAVASQLPEFAYDYDLYKDAIALFNARQRSDRPAAPGRELYILTLDEFVEALEWREKELERLREELPKTSKWDECSEVNMWKWPSKWGELQWSTSILRGHVSIFDAEQDLMQTRAALERHRTRQLLEKRGHTIS